MPLSEKHLSVHQRINCFGILQRTKDLRHFQNFIVNQCKNCFMMMTVTLQTKLKCQSGPKNGALSERKENRRAVNEEKRKPSKSF